MSSSTYIYTGPWVNYSHSAWKGATLTLNNRDSAFLLAFLAIVVTTAGSSFWSIVSYTIHQIRSNPSSRDAIFYQQQPVLKNCGSAFSAAWKFIKTSFAWRRHKRTKWWQIWRSRALGFVVLALSIASAFTVAGIFSSQVIKAASSEVLIQSKFCGNWIYTDVVKFQLKILNSARTAADYARNCYNAGNTSSPQCARYVIPAIPSTVDANASCPFASGKCFWSNTAAYQMSTGLMDSHDILGINSEEVNRVKLRKLTTCAPIYLGPYLKWTNITNYVPDGNGSSVPVQDRYLRLYVGTSDSGTDWSYQYNSHSSVVNIGYELVGLGYSWDWIPAFNRSDADVAIFLLFQNNVIYTYNNTDVFFSANKPLGSQIISNVSSFYLSDYLVSGIGCVDSYQICNPNVYKAAGDSGCTPNTSYANLIHEYNKIDLNGYQLATAKEITTALFFSNMFGAVNGRGSLALQAQDTTFSSVVTNQVGRIPNNQWQIELDGWFAISLARLQQELVQDASGLGPIEQAGGDFVPPSEKYGRAICERQMIRNAPGYQNFSTIGVSLTLIIGAILIALGLSIDSIVGSIKKRRKFDYSRLSWTSDGYLQVQRMAWEGVGYSGWRKCDDDVPTSTALELEDQKLGILDIGALEHPKLFRPSHST